MQDAPSDDATTFLKYEYAGAYHRVLMSSDPLYIAKITKALSLIRDGGSVDGDIVSPRVAIAEGAHFRGSVDMQRKAGQESTPPKPASPGAPQAQMPGQVAQPTVR